MKLLAIVLVTAGIFFSHCSASLHGPTVEQVLNTLQDTDFIFNLAGSTPGASGAGGDQFVSNRETTRALRLTNGRNGGGGEVVLFEFAPCGFRTPHHHPRGTENFYIIKGDVRAVFVRETGEAVVNNVPAGFTGFFPEGNVHFLQNFGCKNATTISMFDNSDPGVIDVATTLRLPRDTIQLALGNMDLRPDDALIDSIIQQSKVCLKRCGIKPPRYYW